MPLVTEEGRQLGVLRLGERRNGRAYAARDRKALAQLAGVVARAIEQDSAGP